MALEFYQGNQPDGNGAHKKAKIITPINEIFLFLDNGDISSAGFALGFLELNKRRRIAINQKFIKTKKAILPKVAYL